MRHLHILSVGRDRHLMEVRSMLLRNSGYDVEEAYSSAEALERLQSTDTDLLLICHTVSPSEHKQLIIKAQEMGRLLPVICLIAREGDSFPDCTNVENSPAALMEAISAVAGLPARSASSQLRLGQR